MWKKWWNNFVTLFDKNGGYEQKKWVDTRHFVCTFDQNYLLFRLFPNSQYNLDSRFALTSCAPLEIKQDQKVIDRDLYSIKNFHDFLNAICDCGPTNR